MDNDISKISNIFRGFYNKDSYNTNEILDNELKLIYKSSNKSEYKIIVKFIHTYKDYKKNEKQDNVNIELDDFLEESNKNFFSRINYKNDNQEEVVAFSPKRNYLLTELDEMQQKNSLKKKKNKKPKNIISNDFEAKYLIQPITHFDFYCKNHAKKYSYFELNSKKKLCTECLFLSYDHDKYLIKSLTNIFCIAKILNKNINVDNQIIYNILDKNKKNEMDMKKNKDIYNIKNMIALEDYKLDDILIENLQHKIKQFEKKLEEMKNTKRYDDNINLLKYCKMYIDFYIKNKDIGINYTVSNIIQNNIKFNDNYLVQDKIQNNNELILNIQFENVDDSIIFTQPIHKITYPEIDNLNLNKDPYDEESISTVFMSDDKTKFTVCFTTAIIKIYEIKNFNLLHDIDFKEECKKSNINDFVSSKEYFYAKLISNGDLVITNLDSYAYLLNIKNKNYSVRKIFDNYNDIIFYFIEIPENKHYVTGGEKVNVYDYNYQKISCLDPIRNNDCGIKPARVKSLLYLPKKKLMICLMVTYGNGASRNSGITVFDTKNKKYKIIWGEEEIYPDLDTPYCMEVFNKKLIIFKNEIYDLKTGEKIYIDFDGKWGDCKLGIVYGKNKLILKDTFDYYFYEFDKDFKLKSRKKLKGITKKYHNEGFVKLTNEFICFFQNSEIIFIK